MNCRVRRVRRRLRRWTVNCSCRCQWYADRSFNSNAWRSSMSSSHIDDMNILKNEYHRSLLSNRYSTNIRLIFRVRQLFICLCRVDAQVRWRSSCVCLQHIRRYMLRLLVDNIDWHCNSLLFVNGMTGKVWQSISSCRVNGQLIRRSFSCRTFDI
jgi:hypothetical protein